MDIQSSTINIADYGAMYDRREIKVNSSYQRSDQVWPKPAQTFLIETILLGYPIPKLFLHQKTDIKARKSYKDVVDGQQRTKAIISFYRDEYALGRNMDDAPEAAGKTYSELPEELQGKFLGYGLNFDIFVEASDEEVREVFRRMNSFTVPLNPEERRHAINQGPFKWFVRKLAADYDTAFIGAGTFNQKQIVRMLDTKLITEIATAYFDGIATTNKTILDNTYKQRDTGEEFGGQAELDRRFRAGLDVVLGYSDLYKTDLLSRAYVVYSFALAVMHVMEPIQSLQKHFKVSKSTELVDHGQQVVNLSMLASALENDNRRQGAHRAFVVASSEKTNVASQRIERFQWLCRAFTEPFPD
jgi:Protein of unknown function DUF262